MNTWWDYIRHQIVVSKQLDADFNCPKMHLLFLWVEQICWFGALQKYSAGRHQRPHKTNLKNCWNASNHNLNYLPQDITSQYRILCFEIRELNLHALTQGWENSTPASKVLPPGADMAAPLSPQTYVKHEFMGPQNRRDVIHPDAIIKDIRALLDNTQHATHRVAIYSGTREFINHKSHNKTYISDEQLHAMELCIYHGIKVQVECLDGESISQMDRCTESLSCHRGDRRNNWVWVKQRLGMCYGALDGRLPWQLHWLFKINLLNEDGAFLEYFVSTCVQHNTWKL